MGPKLFDDFFVFLGGFFFVFVRLLGLRGQAGGTEGGRGGGFSEGNTHSLTFLTDLAPFPRHRFLSGKRTLP